MKVGVLFACYFCMCYTLSFAQLTSRPNQEIKVDLVDPNSSFPGNYYIREGSKVHFKIDNINRNQFNITVNNSTVSLFSEVPPIFKLLTEFDASKLADSAFKTSEKSADEGEEEAALVDNLKDLTYFSDEQNQQRKSYFSTREELRAKISSFIILYENTKSLNAIYNYLSNLYKDDCRKFDEIDNDKLLSAKKAIKDIWEVDVTDAEVRSTLIQKSDELFKETEQIYREIEVANISFKENREMYKKLLGESISVITLKAKSERNKIAKKALEDNLTELNLELSKELAVSNIFDGLLKKVEASYSQVATMEKENFLFNLRQNYDKINRGNFTYISSSFTAAKDIMSTTIKIEPKEALTCGNNYERLNTDISGRVTGFKMNFSTGLFLLGGKKIFDRSYVATPIDGDANNSKIEEVKSREKFAPSIGALMHFYRKRASGFNWGGNFGLSVNNETKLNYHLGLSALFGEEQRIVVSLGFTLARVRLLNSEYQIDGKIPKTITTIPTENFYRIGSFISLTYNLSK